MWYFFILLTTLLASPVAGHGYLGIIQLDHEVHEGFRVNNPNPHANAIGWSFTTPDEGPVLDISHPDFVCRHGAEPSPNYGVIRAGGKVDFFWTSADPIINPDGWAHRAAAIFTYIAPCHGECTAVDKTQLRWTKIQESGHVSGPANTRGIWAGDVMRENMGWSKATIPFSIASGKYVLRHEIIAIHRAHLSEPEFYMQCANIEVTGNGQDDLSDKGIVAAELYSTQDAQLFGFDFHSEGSETFWPIPGPKLYEDEETGRHDSDECLVYKASRG